MCLCVSMQILGELCREELGGWNQVEWEGRAGHG